MTDIIFEGDWAEDRGGIFGGALFVFNPRPAALALVDLARRLLEEAFSPSTPGGGAAPPAGR